MSIPCLDHSRQVASDIGLAKAGVEWIVIALYLQKMTPFVGHLFQLDDFYSFD